MVSPVRIRVPPLLKVLQIAEKRKSSSPFAGKTQGNAIAAALPQDGVTATRLTEGVLHSVGGVITDT